MEGVKVYSPPARTKTPSVWIFIAASLIVTAVAVPVALAAKGGSGKPKVQSASPLSLTFETVWNSPNPAAPTWCMNEDDYHQRTWSGSVSGSFTATEQLCGTDADYLNGMQWDAGGIGLRADLYVTGTLNDVSFTSPQGDAHHGVLVDSTTSNGVKTDHYRMCYVPPFAVSSNTGGTPLPGGTWQINLSGSLTKATFSVTGAMADVTFQQTYCPPSEQLLVR
jgi:hypothetical protein